MVLNNLSSPEAGICFLSRNKLQSALQALFALAIYPIFSVSSTECPDSVIFDQHENIFYFFQVMWRKLIGLLSKIERDKHTQLMVDCSIHTKLFLYSLLYDMLHIVKPYVKEFFDKLTDVDFNHHFVDLFSTVLKTNFSGSGCATKGLLLDVSDKLVKFNQQIKGIEQTPRVALETIEKTFKETTTFKFEKKTNTEQAKATDLLKSIPNIKMSKHLTALVAPIGNLCGSFGNF